MKLKRVWAAVVIALVSSIVPAAHANHGNGGDVTSRSYDPHCENDGTQITIGGNVFQKEWGKHHVVQFEVIWTLYKTNGGAGWTPPYRTKTLRSEPFENTAANYWWDGDSGQLAGGGFGNYWEWTVSAVNSYKLKAKLRWKRKHRPDWTKKITTTYCS